MAALTQLDRIENAILGNGHEGLLTRTARIEENLETASKTALEAQESAKLMAQASEQGFSRVYETIDRLTTNVDSLSKSVEAHHKSEHLTDIIKANPTLTVITEAMKKPNFIRNVLIVIFISFITLHLIATYVPNVWDWIMAWLGLPKLVIPLA